MKPNPLISLAGATGFEPATSGVTERPSITGSAETLHICRLPIVNFSRFCPTFSRKSRGEPHAEMP